MRPGIAFRPEYLDFQRGIRVGNLEDNERITRLLKLELESRYRQEFVTERWGRGVYWRWIGYLNRANRAAKPLSSQASFGCAKFFIMIDTEEQLFRCGMQVERGYVKAPREHRACQLASDWDWQRLIEALKPRSPLEGELKRLLRDGFRVHAGSWADESGEFGRKDYPGIGKLRRLALAAAKSHWAGFQIFYPMREREVQGATGAELIDSMLAVFEEVRPVMNLCMQVHLPKPAA